MKNITIILLATTTLTCLAETTGCAVESSADALAPSASSAQPKPSGPIINVIDLGAVGDDKTDCTRALQQAIDKCAATPGATVLVPQGAYRITPLFLKSHVTLRLESGARLVGPGLFANYPKVKYPAKGALLSGVNLTDVAIVGAGVIDGNAPPRSKAEMKAIGTYQPRLVALKGCKKIRLEGITITHGPNFHASLTGSDIVLDGVKFIAHTGMPWTAGLGLAGERIRVLNCSFETGDDNIAFGGVDDVLIENCHFGVGHGLSIGSYLHSPVRNITVRNCTFENTTAGLRIKSARDRGNVCENIILENITMKSVKDPVSINAYYGLKLNGLNPKDAAKPVTQTTPIYRNIQIVNLKSVDSGVAAVIAGLPEMSVTNVVFKNCRFASDTGMRLMNVNGLQFINTEIQPKSGAALLASNVQMTGAEKLTAAPFPPPGGGRASTVESDDKEAPQ